MQIIILSLQVAKNRKIRRNQERNSESEIVEENKINNEQINEYCDILVNNNALSSN